MECEGEGGGGEGTVLSFVLCQRLTPFTDDCMLVNTPENSEVNGIYRGQPVGICFGCRHARTLCHPCQGLHYRCHLVLLRQIMHSCVRRLTRGPRAVLTADGWRILSK